MAYTAFCAAVSSVAHLSSDAGLNGFQPSLGLQACNLSQPQVLLLGLHGRQRLLHHLRATWHVSPTAMVLMCTLAAVYHAWHTLGPCAAP